MATLIAMASTLMGIIKKDIIFKKAITDTASGILAANVLTQKITTRELRILAVYIFGLLLTAVEVNHIIRAVLKSINASPVKK